MDVAINPVVTDDAQIMKWRFKKAFFNVFLFFVKLLWWVGVFLFFFFLFDFI